VYLPFDPAKKTSMLVQSLISWFGANVLVKSLMLFTSKPWSTVFLIKPAGHVHFFLGNLVKQTYEYVRTPASKFQQMEHGSSVYCRCSDLVEWKL